MEKQIIQFGSAEQGAIDQAQRCLNDAEAFCLMADNHKGYGMPVGGVAVYKDKISPAGVGFDIACGNKAVRLDLKLEDIKDKLPLIAEQIWDKLSFGIGRKNDTKVEHELFDDETWNTVEFLKTHPELKSKAQGQLGTIGSGNHYVDIFTDEEGYIWVGVHFGSRGLGHSIASHFMVVAGDNVNIMDETPHTLDVNSKEGQDYIAAMTLAGKYAYAGRDWVCTTVAEILGGAIIDEIHNHHNFAWKESFDGENYWVVRKGATPAFPGQRGFVGGSMGDKSVILQGIDNDLSRAAFYSTVHGAGRVMSRTQAAGKKKFVKEWQCGMRDCDETLPFTVERGVNGEKPLCPKCNSKMNFRKYFKIVSEGAVNFEEVKQKMIDDGVILMGAGPDEAPQVYKRLPEVLAAHEGTVEILHTLTPLIVCMAGSDEFDPYKD